MTKNDKKQQGRLSANFFSNFGTGRFFALSFCTLLLFSCGGGGDDDPDDPDTPTVSANNVNKNDATLHPEYARLEFPKLKSGNNLVIIHKDGSEVNYSLEWDCDKLSQRWTCYQLYRSNLQQNTSRWYANEGETQYPQDPDLPSQYRLDQDYFYGSGYDHGHICPSADRLKSITSNKQTFYLTNMQPMVNGFNAKVWANMEAAVRNFAKKNNYGICDTLYVCKGGTIDSESNIITRIAGKLIVPKYYFMALLAVKNGTYHAAGLWIEHKASNDEDLAKYAVTIDELEEKTGIDFFCNLPDDKEKTVESTAVAASYWGFQ